MDITDAERTCPIVCEWGPSHRRGNQRGPVEGGIKVRRVNRGGGGCDEQCREDERRFEKTQSPAFHLELTADTLLPSARSGPRSAPCAPDPHCPTAESFTLERGGPHPSLPPPPCQRTRVQSGCRPAAVFSRTARLPATTLASRGFTCAPDVHSRAQSATAADAFQFGVGAPTRVGRAARPRHDPAEMNRGPQ